MDEYRVERAIILAAGRGERLRPMTLHTPKPLIKVSGVPMIESIISALYQNGIIEIYVVVGYLKEHFSYLPEKYPGLKLLENPYYETANNISSLYVAREKLSNCFILDGDQIVKNPAVLAPYFTRSSYLTTWCEEETKEWLLQVEDGVITSCSRTGGKNGYQLYSVSRWTLEDGERLKRHVKNEFERGNTGIYWDDVPLFCYPQEYQLGIWHMQPGDVIEIDSLEELRRFDQK